MTVSALTLPCYMLGPAHVWSAQACLEFAPWASPLLTKDASPAMSRRLPPCCLLSLVALLSLPAQGALAKCKFEKPDMSVIGIKLMDVDSATAVVGPDVDVKEVEDDLPNARFVNKDGSQELVVFSNYSAAGDEFSEFEVKMAGTEAMTLPDLPVATFTSRVVSNSA